MESMIPILVLLMIFWMVQTAAKSKNAKNGKPGGGKSAGKQKESGGNSGEKSLRAETRMDEQLQMEFPHLFTGAGGRKSPLQGSMEGESMEGKDPCHEDMHAIPSGSLAGGSMEGKDPCHDDPRAVPSGSLGGYSPEGEDPCHEDWIPLGTEPEGKNGAPEASGGLNLSWTGDEIVKGFVLGEILKRKAG